MEWLYYLDISMLQVYTINLCIIQKIYQLTEFKVSLDISSQRINEINPSHVAVCWDMGQSTFRNDMYTDYKQNRPAPPEELIPQFDYVKEISDQFGFINVGMTNYEADDVIGTLAKTFSDNNEVHIITGDKDLLQCINNNVEVWLIKKGFNIYNRYTLARFNEEYQLNPRN